MFALSVKIHEDKDGDVLSRFKWTADESRKHWTLNKHCTSDVFLPKFLRNPPLTTDETKFYWHLYCSRGKYDKVHQKNLNCALNSTLLRGLVKTNTGTLSYIFISENLINLGRFDAVSRKNFLDNVARFIRKQPSLKLASFEGLGVTKAEGQELLSALATSAGESLDFLFLWQFFKQTEPPNLHLHRWLKTIGHFRHLETLAVNYAYVSSGTGDVLLHLARHLGRNWKWLQLLCSAEDTTDGSRNAVAIPDFAWNVVRKFSPRLRIQLVMLGIAEYDQQKKFLSPSIPMHTIVLSSDRELLFHKPCMLDCTLKTVYLWYHRHLEQLYLNLWNDREMLDHHLRTIFPCLPNLKVFEFVGVMKDPVTVCTMCCQIKIGACAVKNVTMQLQTSNDEKSRAWLSRINKFLTCFQPEFDKLGVTFVVRQYPA